MEKKTEILENFKTAIGSTVRSISNSENIEVVFGDKNLKSNQNIIKLPEIENTDKKINYKQIRALADSKSLKLRLSDNKIFNTFEPQGNISRKLYEIAEKIRYEKIGSEQFTGIKNNITNYYIERLNALDLKNSEDKIIESFENYLRVKFFDTKIDKEQEKKLKTYKKDLNDKFKDKIKKLSSLTYDQAKYNSLISSLISDMSLDEELKDEDIDERNKEEKQTKPNKQEQNTEKQAKEQEMSIEAGVPDIENEAKSSDQEGEDIEIEDKSKTSDSLILTSVSLE